MMAYLAALSTFEHYHSHLWPIVEGLRDRGHEVRDVTTWRNAPFADYTHPKDLAKHRPVVWLTAGALDAKNVAPAPTIYVEHGAGQTYDADLRGAGHESYSTGTIPNAAGFLCPNLFVATRRRRLQPDVPAVAVGSPRLDPYPVGAHAGVERAIAFAFHWDCNLVPETKTAFDHYLPGLLDVSLALRRKGWLPVVHGHPRIARRVRYHLERKGFEWWDIDDVMTRAAVLVADNTSVLYEFAHVDRPIVVMNAPWYRKHVHHGLRFWECVPGEQVDEPEDLLDALRRAVTTDPFAEDRRRCAELVFPLNTERGESTAMAVSMVEMMIEAVEARG